MISVDLQVKHKTFGIGVITSINGKYITVKFDGCEKNFVYPDSFEKFLTLADGTVTDDILSDLSISKNEKDMIREKKNLENAYSMTHGIVIPGKEISSENEDEDSSFKNGENEDN